MTTVKVQIKPEDVAKRRLAASKKLKKTIAKQQEKFRRYGVAYLRQKALEKNIWFKGRFFRGIQADRRASLGLTIEFKNTASHAIFVEMGRRKGARMPPISALIPWVRARFGVSLKQATRIAWGVAKNISKNGIKKRRIITSGHYQRHLRSVYNKACQAALAEAVK